MQAVHDCGDIGRSWRWSTFSPEKSPQKKSQQKEIAAKTDRGPISLADACEEPIRQRVHGDGGAVVVVGCRINP
jgi:hypothetical protein